MKRIALLIALLVLLFVMLPAGAAFAAPNFDRIIGEGETVHEDLVIFGGSLVIKNGATVEGDVSVFGGTATIDGDIEGDVAIFGGIVDLNGAIDGDMVVFGGSLGAGSEAEIDGECVLVGGSLSGEGASGLGCAEVGEFSLGGLPALVNPPLPPISPTPPVSPGPVPPVTRIEGGRGFFGTIADVAGRSLLLGIIALVAGYIAPNQLRQVRDTFRHKPAASGAVGVLTVFAVPTLAIILLVLSIILTLVCIGLLGYPIVLALLIALAVGILMGWVAAGTLLGQRLATLLKMSDRSIPVTAALGTAILTLAAGFLSALPFWLGGWFWWLAAVLIGCAGLGAVALTRFGTRPYPLVVADNAEKVEVVLETLPVEDVGAMSQKPPLED